jgi:hypothetical protein
VLAVNEIGGSRQSRQSGSWFVGFEPDYLLRLPLQAGKQVLNVGPQQPICIIVDMFTGLEAVLTLQLG